MRPPATAGRPDRACGAPDLAAGHRSGSESDRSVARRLAHDPAPHGRVSRSRPNHSSPAGQAAPHDTGDAPPCPGSQPSAGRRTAPHPAPMPRGFTLRPSTPTVSRRRHRGLCHGRSVRRDAGGRERVSFVDWAPTLRSLVFVACPLASPSTGPCRPGTRTTSPLRVRRWNRSGSHQRWRRPSPERYGPGHDR